MSVIQSKVVDILSGKNLGEVVNDFSIQIGSANGSGSQTSNMVLVRALFRMGIPVSGKNLFPSNIQGLPTWYTIRCSHAGYVARQPSSPVVVLMNPETAVKDLAGLESGGVCFYPDDLKLDLSRQDVTYYPMPVKMLTSVPEVPRHLRTYIGNMVYVGVLAQLLQIEMSALEAALDWQFGGRTKLVNANLPTIKAAFDWAAANIAKRDPYRVERMNATAGYMLVDGNTAGGLGSVYGGMTVTAWYPITPSTSLADAMSEYASSLRRDPDGKANYAIVQAEDELAARILGHRICQAGGWCDWIPCRHRHAAVHTAQPAGGVAIYEHVTSRGVHALHAIRIALRNIGGCPVKRGFDCRQVGIHKFGAAAKLPVKRCLKRAHLNLQHLGQHAHINHVANVGA